MERLLDICKITKEFKTKVTGKSVHAVKFFGDEETSLYLCYLTEDVLIFGDISVFLKRTARGASANDQ